MQRQYFRLKRFLFTAWGMMLTLVLAACTLANSTLTTPSPGVALPVDELPNNLHNPSPTAPPAGPGPITPAPVESSTPDTSPTSLPSPTPFLCKETRGSFLHDQLTTDLLRYPLDFRVYLPPCYDQEPERSYPVLYLLHGQSSTDDQWDRLGADEAADLLISSGEASPFLIVMPRYRNWFQPDEHHFGQAMVEALIPHIDNHFRTIPDRSMRAIGGLSMGGGWALHLGLSQWELFGAVGLHSLALFSVDSPLIPGWLDSIPPDQLPRIYIDIGDRDSRNLLDSTRWFEETLTRKDIPHEWYLFSGYHEEKYWQAHSEAYLRWYTREW